VHVNSKTWARAAAAFLLAGVTILSTAQASTAGGIRTFYRVVPVTDYLSSGPKLGSCIVSSAGGGCTVTSGKTATRTISVELGYTRAGVAGKLGISSAKSTTITVGCSWSTKGTHYAYAYGRQYSYRIQEWYDGPTPKLIETSDVVHAFDPFSNSIYCGA